MAKFVKLTIRKNGATTYLNMDRVLSIRPNGSGADLILDDTSKSAWEVEESPDDIVQQANS